MDQRTGCEHLPVNYSGSTQKITPDIQYRKKKTSDYQRCCKNVGATDTTIISTKNKK